MDKQPQAAILIIDDDSNVRRLLQYALKRAGYVIYEAEDGFQGLEMYKQFQPDIVLLDALMPGLDGFEVCAQLRELPYSDQVPILMVTALDDAPSIDRAFEVGATDYITKPINQTVLSHRIRRLLLTRRAQRQVYFQASLLDQVRNAVIATDEQGTIIYCNKAAEILYQWKPREVINQPIQEVICSPGDRALFENILIDAEQIGFWEGELNIQDKNGTSFPTQMSLNMTRNTQSERIGFVAVLTDISERMRAEQALRQSQKLYSTLAKNFPNGAVLLFDQDLRYIIADGAGLAAMRLSSHALEGKTIRQACPPEFCAIFEPFYLATLDGKSTILETPYLDHVYLAYTIPVRDERGEIHVGLSMMQDITGRKQVEEELDEHRHHLEKLVEERTTELTKSNAALQQEIAERQRAEKELEYRVEFEKQIANISAYFIYSAPLEIDKGVDLVLRTIGQFAGADRGYIFVFSDDGNVMTNTHEWCVENLEPQLSTLKEIPVRMYSWWIEMLSSQESIYLPSIARLPSTASVERQFFQSRQVESLMAVPLVSEGTLLGFIGFDSIRTDTAWPNDFSTLLKITGEIIVNALEHKRTEEALHRSEQQLRQITDTMLDTVYQTDAQGIIEYASPSCLDVLGYSAATIRGMSIYAQIHPEDVEYVREAVYTVGRVEYRYQHANGYYIWLETLSNLLLQENGDIAGIVFASRDVTERKRVEKEAQELNRLKTEFLSTAAHELRTPLTSIRGFSEILLTRQLAPDRQQRYLKLVNEQSTQLGTLIDDLLDISRLEAKRSLTLNLGPVNLSELLEEVSQPFIESLSTHYIQVEVLPQCPPVNGDPFRLTQVIKNLLSNAVKYSSQGSVVTIRNEVIEGYMRVGVQDQGIGMTPEQQAHLFEKFYRADASNMAVGGTGLGLAISKLIVELHGGKIWAESEQGAGSTFFFTLPIMSHPNNEPG